MALVEHQAILAESIEIGPSVRRFRFHVPAIDRFDFLPGQWVSMIASIGGKKVTRAYSLASLPNGNEFEVCLNRVEGGLFSPHLFALEAGQSVAFRGPVGAFTLRDPKRESIFVGTGTGVVPFRPMLQQPGFLDQGAKATLIFGARYSSGLIFSTEFEELARRIPNFRYIPTVTRPDTDWTGATGRVQPILWEQLGDTKDADVYICGLKDMVDDVREQLKLRGFDKKQIVYEKYD